MVNELTKLENEKRMPNKLKLVRMSSLRLHF